MWVVNDVASGEWSGERVGVVLCMGFNTEPQRRRGTSETETEQGSNSSNKMSSGPKTTAQPLQSIAQRRQTPDYFSARCTCCKASRVYAVTSTGSFSIQRPVEFSQEPSGFWLFRR